MLGAPFTVKAADSESAGLPPGQQSKAIDISEMKRMAENGDVTAMFDLGHCYHYGFSISKNINDAEKWYRQAADHGNARAMFFLGVIYEDGGVGDINTDFRKEAVKWYRQAADLGDAQAMRQLGTCYKFGKGVRYSESEAAAWYQKAADLGDEEAMYQLGLAYVNGWGIKKDKKEAVRWYRQAADHGNGNAMCALGICYESGVNLPQSDVYAYMWFILAASKDALYGASLRDEVRKRLTPEQIAEAQKLATIYSEKKEKGSDVITNNITTKNIDPVAIGTGFFVTTNGYLLTAYYVVAKADSVKVNVNGKMLEAKVIQVDAANDVALLKVTGSFAALAVISNRGVKLGTDVFTVGFPNIVLQGTAPKLTKGNINALSGIQDDPRAFQVSVPIQPGNSGGPLLDPSGNVVGMVVSQLDVGKTALITGSLPQGVNYAIKSAYVQPLLEAIPETSSLAPTAKTRSFEDATKAAEPAVCIVLSYSSKP